MLSADRLLGELALSGRLDRQELCRVLDPAGVGERVAVLAFALPDPQEGLPVLERSLSASGTRGLGAICEGLLCAIVDCTHSLPQQETAPFVPSGELMPSDPHGAAPPAEPSASDPVALAGRIRRELSERFGEVWAAASRAGASGDVHRSFHEARCALVAARTANEAGAANGARVAGGREPVAANGRESHVACYDDLGSLKLLLGLQPREALEAYCRIVLGPVEAQGGQYGEELLRSLDAFIEHNGHWEHAARALYCHRHTLRYRIRRVEQLTERDFSRARDRIELWLALRGRELVR